MVFFSLLKDFSNLISDYFLRVALNILNRYYPMIVLISLLNGTEYAASYRFDSIPIQLIFEYPTNYAQYRLKSLLGIVGQFYTDSIGDATWLLPGLVN